MQNIKRLLPFFDPQLFRLAFVSLSLQQNLYKIVSKDSKKYGKAQGYPRKHRALKNHAYVEIIFNPKQVGTESCWRKKLAKKN
ncbi:MAG: hypothetical protein M1549_04165 [Candidatus Dependentiae bacterium]|nr:hypothetical protein [Candidatus Dependentiae bacterium]